MSGQLVEFVVEKTIPELQSAMQRGEVTSRQLAEAYLQRIAMLDQNGPALCSVIETNPDALTLADALDAERQRSGARGPLHGIPILIKDNIDTTDRMLTTAGSLAMVDSRPPQEATVVTQLRSAGALLLGKTNLSEWANFRSSKSISGWSGRGGQTQNPYRIGYNPCGSSSGSGSAMAANLAAASLGTETDGSIVCPSTVNGIVGLKPTLGLTSRAGVVPIAHSQDTVGPMTRTVTDAAILMGAITGVDTRDPATQASMGRSFNDYTPFLQADGLRGARIGVARQVYAGYHAGVDQCFEEALTALHQAGAEVIDPADIPTAQTIKGRDGEFKVLLYEFKRDLAAYLATRIPNTPSATIPRTLADLIAYNEQHASLEMPLFGQELFTQSEELPLSEAEYLEILAENQRLAGKEGIDAALANYRLDALVAPTGGPAWPNDPTELKRFLGSSSTAAALAGYPLLTVPMGFVEDLPVGITFMGAAYSEPTLIRLGYAFEQATRHRQPPQYRRI